MHIAYDTYDIAYSHVDVIIYRDCPTHFLLKLCITESVSVNQPPVMF